MEILGTEIPLGGGRSEKGQETVKGALGKKIRDMNTVDSADPKMHRELGCVMEQRSGGHRTRITGDYDEMSRGRTRAGGAT